MRYGLIGLLGMGLLLACGETTQSSSKAGGAAGGGAGGGAEPVTPQVTCSSLTGYPDLSPSPGQRTEVVGSNGSFVDQCDADGNVIEYHCLMQQLCGADGIDCAPYPTGIAAPRTVTCGAGCAAGVCLD